MLKSAVAVAIVCVGVGVGEGDAHACGPTRPPPSPPPCTSLTLWAPGEQFPVDIALDTLRIGLWNVANNTMTAKNDGYPLSTPLEIYRETPTGFESVAFALSEQTGVVSNGRAVRLADPQPGKYHFAWAGDTCSTQPSPASPSSKKVGELTLTPSAPIPTTLGTLTATEPVTRSYDRQEGVGGDCSPIFVHLDEAEVIFTLTPSADILPWADAIETSLQVDNATNVSFSKPRPASRIADGSYTMRVTRICNSDKPQYLEHPGIAEGKHVAKIVAHIEGRESSPITSAEVPFEVRCDIRPSSPPGSSDSSGNSGNSGNARNFSNNTTNANEGSCTVASSGLTGAQSSNAKTATITIATAAVILTLLERRRRRSRRRCQSAS